MNEARKAPTSRKPQIVRARILDAAESEFVEVGYAAASTNRILDRFGGSKPTMFRHFPTKRALFEGVLTRIAGRWRERIDLDTIGGESPVDWLADFTFRAARWVLSESSLFLGRMAVAEGHEFPEGAELYRQIAADPVEALLVERFEDWNARGLMASRNPKRDAIAFLDLALSGLVSRRLYRVIEDPDDVSLRDHARYVAALFLDGRRPR